MVGVVFLSLFSVFFCGCSGTHQLTIVNSHDEEEDGKFRIKTMEEGGKRSEEGSD